MSYYMEQLGGATDMHGGKTRWFQDENEPEKLISEAQLKKEYGSNVADGSIDPAEKTFQDYLWCCMSSQGGTLTEVFPEKETKATICRPTPLPRQSRLAKVLYRNLLRRLSSLPLCGPCFPCPTCNVPAFRHRLRKLPNRERRNTDGKHIPICTFACHCRHHARLCG